MIINPGASEKSAYQYAVDGGYTGTEAEFQALMGSGPWLPTAGGTMTGKITGIVTPTAKNDAANKAYVDNIFASAFCVDFQGSELTVGHVVKNDNGNIVS